MLPEFTSRPWYLIDYQFFCKQLSVPARGTKKDSLAAVFFHALSSTTGGLIPQTPWVELELSCKISPPHARRYPCRTKSSRHRTGLV